MTKRPGFIVSIPHWEGHDLNPHPPGKKLPRTYATHSASWLRFTKRRLSWTGLGYKQGDSSNVDSGCGQIAMDQDGPAHIEADPSMSRSRNLAFSEEDNVFILESSAQTGKGSEPQIWTYRYRKPGTLAPTPVPVNLRGYGAPQGGPDLGRDHEAGPGIPGFSSPGVATVEGGLRENCHGPGNQLRRRESEQGC